MANKTVLITGSSKGLGAELALVFARNNHNVILHGRNKDNLERIRKNIIQTGVECYAVTGDLLAAKTINNLSEMAKDLNTSILINNAGVSLTDGNPDQDLKLPLNMIRYDQIDTILGTNLVAAIKLTKEIYSLFLRKKRGTIININSLLGLEPREMNAIYCASKWGLRGFTDAFRLEAEKNGVRVMAVYPTRIKTKPVFTEGMEPEKVALDIYNAYMGTTNDVVLDGRPKS